MRISPFKEEMLLKVVFAKNRELDEMEII